MAYLYGAAVQGIQEFIFQTNKLREIVGASELVEEICTSKFARVLGKKGKYKELKELLIKDENAIVHAAGNIKYIFKTKGYFYLSWTRYTCLSLYFVLSCLPIFPQPKPPSPPLTE